jgi:hypothetical protein
MATLGFVMAWEDTARLGKLKKALLFCKKEAKNFSTLGHGRFHRHRPKLTKFFLLLFCSQKRRPSLLLRPTSDDKLIPQPDKPHHEAVAVSPDLRYNGIAR